MWSCALHDEGGRVSPAQKAKAGSDLCLEYTGSAELGGSGLDPLHTGGPAVELSLV